MFLMILWSIVFIRMITVSPWGGWMYRIKLMMTLWTGYGNREGRDIKHGITAGKTYPKVAAGTWPDDGVQALCLMDSLLRHGKFSLKAYSDALLAWYEKVSGRSMERYSMLGFRQRMRLEHIKKESLQRIAD